MGRLRDWWQRLTGTEAPQQARQSAPAPTGPQQSADGLELTDEVPRHPPSRIGEAGFDPYANDAGLAKPHTWERVDHD